VTKWIYRVVFFVLLIPGYVFLSIEKHLDEAADYWRDKLKGGPKP